MIVFAICPIYNNEDEHAKVRLLLRRLAMTFCAVDSYSLTEIRSERGKPSFKERHDVKFSLSHSNSLAAAVIAFPNVLSKDASICTADFHEIGGKATVISRSAEADSVGIDVQLIDTSVTEEKIARFGKRFPSLETPSKSAEEFFSKWVRAESRAKSSGEGLSGLSSSDGEILHEETISLPDGNYRIAIAAHGTIYK